jgi:hypothetical protein
MSLDIKTAAALRPFAFPRALLLPGFAVTLFTGACLLFLVQPMVSKMMLPRLGGSPSVWNTCMCFFQAALLLGYAYAHWLANRFGGRAQAAIHAAVLALAALFLPLDLTAQVPPTEGSPVPWLLAALATTVGPPFFAISATAPLLQRWFSRTDHPDAGDPYFLYAASNAGSLLALLAYPLIVEPTLKPCRNRTATGPAGLACWRSALRCAGWAIAAIWRQRQPSPRRDRARRAPSGCVGSPTPLCHRVCCSR